MGGWDYAVATPDLAIAAGAEGGTLRRWTEPSGADIHAAMYWEVTRVLQLAPRGMRALVEGRGEACVSGRCQIERALWDGTLGWARFSGSLSGDGRVVARAARCEGRAVVERIELSMLDELQTSMFWSDHGIGAAESLGAR